MTLAISHRRSDGRPDLYLVPPLNESDPLGTDRVITVPRQRRASEDRVVADPPAHHRSVRLTRRGRIVLGALLLALAVGLALLLAPATQAAAPTGSDRTIVVHSGDTLWSIATVALPHDDPYAAAERVRVLNHLSDNRIYVGEQLLLPAA